MYMQLANVADVLSAAVRCLADGAADCAAARPDAAEQLLQPPPPLFSPPPAPPPLPDDAGAAALPPLTAGVISAGMQSLNTRPQPAPQPPPPPPPSPPHELSASQPSAARAALQDTAAVQQVCVAAFVHQPCASLRILSVKLHLTGHVTPCDSHSMTSALICAGACGAVSSIQQEAQASR